MGKLIEPLISRVSKTKYEILKVQEGWPFKFTISAVLRSYWENLTLNFIIENGSIISSTKIWQVKLK